MKSTVSGSFTMCYVFSLYILYMHIILSKEDVIILSFYLDISLLLLFLPYSTKYAWTMPTGCSVFLLFVTSSDLLTVPFSAVLSLHPLTEIDQLGPVGYSD